MKKGMLAAFAAVCVCAPAWASTIVDQQSGAWDAGDHFFNYILAQPGTYQLTSSIETGAYSTSGSFRTNYSSCNVVFGQLSCVPQELIQPLSVDGASGVTVFPTFELKSGREGTETSFILWSGQGSGHLTVSVDHHTNYMVTLELLDPAPEPSTWTLMIGGLGLAGVRLRHRRATRLQRA